MSVNQCDDTTNAMWPFQRTGVDGTVTQHEQERSVQ